MIPLLTIAIPTYRRKTYLLELLSSIRIKTSDSREVEVVVSDNGSDYDAEEAIVGLNLPYSVRVHINESNIGATQNFINCVGMARGRFVWLIGDDELLAENAVETVLSRLRNHPDLGLMFLSAANWPSSPPFERRYEGYSAALQELGSIDPSFPLKQTLISVVVFRKVDFDFGRAYKEFASNYGQAYGMLNNAGRRPVVLLSSEDPVVIVRPVRADFDEPPPRLVWTQAQYLRYLSREFGAFYLRRFARRFLWKSRKGALADWFLRSWKGTSPRTYGFVQRRFGKTR